MPFPTVHLGSFGDAVKTLQGALNLWPQSLKPQLTLDGSFGPKTDGKVREFQSKKQLLPDGIVGPITWQSLQPLVDQLLGLVGPPKSDVDAGERIAAAANAALGVFGWAGGTVTPNKLSARIAAAICADPADPLRPRQGGVALMSVFQIAGAPGVYVMRCPTISKEAAAQWQLTTGEARETRNSIDIPAWCGIFCYYVYRCAGINMGGWINHKSNMSGNKYRKMSDPAQAFRGCIGVEDGIKPGGRNHHFIVMTNQNGVISSIDGNSFGPIDGNFSTGVRSVIAPKTYTHQRLKNASAYFLFPA
jgi:peptidoglycan hydrolase-like protein with peptidoglycan-binding domain